MRLRRLGAVFVTAAALVTAQVAVAGPAAADHLVGASSDGCFTGVFALTRIPLQLRTSSSWLRTERDGTIVVRCHFKGLPADLVVEEPAFHWTLPTQAWRLEDAGSCQLTEPGFDDVIGEAVSVVVTPAGTLKVECVFRPPFGP